MEYPVLLDFKLSTLAKEVGFDWPTDYYYMSSGRLYSFPLENHNRPGLTKEKCSAPEEAHLQRWLREVKGIHIWVETVVGYRLDKMEVTDYRAHILSTVCPHGEFTTRMFEMLPDRMFKEYGEAQYAVTKTALEFLKEKKDEQ